VITLDDYWMGRDKDYPPTATQRMNAKTTVDRANLLLAKYYAKRPTAAKAKVSSGYRPPAINAKTSGAAVRSKHMSCEAVDLSDPKGELGDWCMHNGDILTEVGLWLENPSATPTWCHVQTVPPKSGRRVFYP